MPDGSGTEGATQSTGSAKGAIRRLGWAAMSRASLRRTRWLFLVGVAASLILLVAAAIWILEQERRSDEAVSHTFQNEKQLARVLSLLQDAELGQRGYELCGKVGDDGGLKAAYRGG